MHDCPDMSMCIAHTAATLSAVAKRLAAAAAHMGKDDFKELQTRLGWSWEPAGILQNARWSQLASPPAVVAFDWMHIYFVNGVFNSHCGLLLKAFRQHGVKSDLLCSYMDQWHWPKAVGSSTGADMFSTKRVRSHYENASLRATASECLSIWPILAHFCESVGRSHTDPAIVAHSAAFLDMARVFQLILGSARRPLPPAALQEAIRGHMASFLAVFGREAVVPKFHYALHLPGFLERWGFVPSVLGP